ncbi:phage minor head protein [Arthrobacter burdickii]|uniref:Phage minor head protein n=1 Tax=Arthrobacter burdickii TaxID=3035920 RepID=A0ABT8K3L3_9MICC|nr:phage minor head protein [Arthrobacter burdickii]MDN4611944.1 phage minor head protein [Arthrobacter burdickii]
MSINARTLALLADRRDDLNATLDAQTLALTKAWVEAWDTLAPDFDAALTELLASAKDGRLTGSQVARNIRLRKALSLAAERLDELAELTQVTVQADVARAALAAAQSQIDTIASQLPPEGQVAVLPTFTQVSTPAMDAIVTRITQQITKDTLPLSEDAQLAMRRNLVRGVAVGDNPRVTARRMIRETEGHFNGGLNRALTIARTETLDAHRSGGRAADIANPDVVAGWSWGSQLSARTCIACLSKHGTEYPPDVEGPNGHQNCRCDRIPVTKTWRELGFDIEEPPSLTKSSEEWFGSLTDKTQLQIMGPGRLELYKSGAASWSDLSRVQQNDGWRDSVTITPVRDLRASVLA